MVWGGISGHGKTLLAIMKGNQDSKKYVEVLERTLLPFKDDEMHIEWVFMQDNAAIHTSHYRQEWLNAHHIRTMDSPARSPDLNPIENAWRWLTRAVYRDHKQYKSIEELHKSVVQKCAEMPDELVNSLFACLLYTSDAADD